MLARAFDHYDRLLAARRPQGPVLEVGAVPSDHTLLRLPALQGVEPKLGVNLAPPTRHRGIAIAQANANALPFLDASFGVVLCNAVLEHDPYFWTSLAEIRRVTRRGGLIAIGAPGYATTWRDSIQRWLRPCLALAPRLSQYLTRFVMSTATISVHESPGDYYRFSPAAFERVFFAGLSHVEIATLLYPPIVIGIGMKED